MQIFSNHLDEPYNVSIHLQQNKKRPWLLITGSEKTRYSTLGKLLVFLKYEGMLTLPICKALFQFAKFPPGEEWESFDSIDVELLNIVYGSTVLFIEKLYCPLSGALAVYILDRERFARVVEINIADGLLGRKHNCCGEPFLIRVSSQLV